MDFSKIAFVYYLIGIPVLFLILFGTRHMSEDRGVRPDEEFMDNLRKNGL